MKQVVLVAVSVAVAIAVANPVAAQVVRDETTLTFQVLTEEWDGLIGSVLKLTDAEAEAFWPLYREYLKAKGELWRKRIDLAKLFVRNYNDMSPEMARLLLDQNFAIDTGMLELEMAWAERFDEVLPPNKVVRLYQSENKLETTMMAEIIKDVPLAK